MKNNFLFTVFVLALILTGAFNGFSQEDLKIEGGIYNSRSEPIEGVSVSVEGEAKAPVVTDSLGYFVLTTEKPVAWISFTPYKDYKVRRVFFRESGRVKIYLTDNDLESGGDVILDISGERERDGIVSGLTSMDTKLFDLSSHLSVDQYIQGRVPGVFFNGHSGMPGAGGVLYLKGLAGSFHANTMPRIMIDGMPLENGNIYSQLAGGSVYNPLSVISPQDISGISVIRGASASLLGVKGSNGIVLIETLNPREITTSMEFNFNTGVNFKGKELPQLDARQYKTLANEVLMSSGKREEDFTTEYPGLYLAPGDQGYIRYSHDYNWQEDIFSNSTFRDAYFNIMGGDAIGRYGLSVGYSDHNGIFRNTDFSRFTSRFVGKFNMFEWLRVSVSANLATSTAGLKESSLSRQTSPVITALSKSPMLFPFQYDQNNNQLLALEEVDELGVSNPKAVIDLFSLKNSNTRFLTSFRLEGDITNELNFGSILGLNINALRQNGFYPNQGMEFYYEQEVLNAAKSMTNNLFSMYNDNFIGYRQTFGGIHKLEVFSGVKWQTTTFEEDLAIAKNLNPNDQFQFLQAGSSLLSEIGGDTRNWNWMSGYTRVNYSLNNKYLFETNASVDLSSNVGREAENVFLVGNVPFGFFYSGAFSWRISQENFLRRVTFIDDLRLNMEYGVTGNDDIGTRNRQDYYSLVLYRETAGMVPNGYANPALGYEKTRDQSLGFDLWIRGGRYKVSARAFKSNISDMLIYQTLSSYLGDNQYPVNSASMINQGIYFDIFGRMINNQDFKLDLGMNLTRVRNEITSIAGGEIAVQMPGYEIINREGSQAKNFYGYVFEGVFRSTDEAEKANLINELGIPFGAGDAVFKDISGPDGEPDGAISDYDKTLLGSAQPDIFGGFTTGFSFKRWSVSVLWQFSYGNEIFNFIRFQNEKMTDLSNQSITTLRRWTTEGQVTDIPRAKWKDPTGNSQFSSRWIEDGSYLRCKDITLSYRLPENFLVFKDLTLYANGINLITFSKYLGYDPEVGYSYHPFTSGVDYGLMPQFRRVLFGVKLGL